MYLSAANALNFGGYFALYGATLMYTYLYHGTEIANAWKNVFGKGYKVKDDIHFTLMKSYKEVPESWYWGVMIMGTFMAFLMIWKFPTDMPIWGIFFALAIGLIFIVPVGLISAVSGVEIGLNVLSEMVAGFAMPGKPLAMMIFSMADYGFDIVSPANRDRDLRYDHSCTGPLLRRGPENRPLQ